MSWSIPFDNLYKFIATVGVILCILSFIFPIYIDKSYYLDNIKYDRQNYIDSVKLISVFEKGVYVNHVYDSLEKDRIGELKWTKNEQGQFIADSTNYNIYRFWYNEQEKLMSEMSALSEERQTAQKHLKEEFVTRDIVNKSSFVAFVFGFIMTCFGFYRWYNSVQVYQDLVVEKDAGFPITNQGGYYDLLAKRKIKPMTFILFSVIVLGILLAIKTWIIN